MIRRKGYVTKFFPLFLFVGFGDVGRDLRAQIMEEDDHERRLVTYELTLVC